MDIPNAGSLRRAPLDCDVIVGTFEEAPSGSAGEKLLLPDLSKCQLPLRMKISPADPTVKTSEETLTLQDASGKNAFKGVPGTLDNNYVIVVEDTSSSSDGSPVYQVLPVSHWVAFQRVSSLPQLTVDEQAELYDMLQKYGEKPSRATLAMEKYKSKVKGTSKFADEGGVANLDDLEDTEAGFGGNYRTSMAASIRRKQGGAAGDDGPVFDGDDFDAAYDNILGGGAKEGEGGAGEDEYGDTADAEAGVRARDGQGFDEDVRAAIMTKQFDVVGDEAGGEEAGADLMMDYFADDAGDDGGFGDDDGIRADHDWNAEDIEQGGAAAMRGALGEEELGVDLDSDALNEDDLAKAAALAAAGPARQEEEDKKKGKRGPSADLEGRAAKRGRFDADNLDSMRDELNSFIRSQGGKCTAAALSKAFGSYLKDAQAKQRFFAVVGDVTKQVKEIDGKLYFVLKK